MDLANWEPGKHGRNSAFNLGLTLHGKCSSKESMKTTGLLALALFSAGTFVHAAEDAAKPKPALSARLENPKLADDAKSLTVDFILTNQSDKPVIFAERWNSWGAYQWSLKVHLKKGDPLEFTNPQQTWTRNFLSVVTLEPGKEHTSHCLVALASPSPWPEKVDVFTPAKDTGLQDLKTASGLSGVFSAEEIHKESLPDGSKKRETNWTGKVTTEKIAIPGK